MSKENKKFNWTLEGVTAQYSGEVLFDVPETRQVRQECRHSYLSCLDDWFFAIIYGDRIEIALPGMVGKSRPGHELINRCSESVKIVAPRSEFSSPQKLLENKEFRTTIGNDLQRLDQSLKGSEHYWRQWITREAEAFFGNDSSVYEGGKFGKYCFKKNPPLIFDQKLVELIPEHSMTLLYEVVKKHLQDNCWKVAHPDAIKEFVQCNFLTLITISRWYDASASVGGNIRLPSPVRSLIYQSARIGSLDSYLQEVRSIVTHNALGMILETRPVANPDRLIKLAYQLREDKKIIKVRCLLSDLFQELGIGHEKDITKHEKDIAKLRYDISTFSKQAAKWLECPSPVRIEREWQPSVNRAIQRVEKKLGHHGRYYIGTLERLFPELFGSPPIVSRTVMGTHIDQYISGDKILGDKILGDKIAGDKVLGDKIDTQINNAQDLSQAADAIKDLLVKLSDDYPDDSPRVLSAKAMDQVENNPELKSRIIRGVKAGSLAALEKMIDHPLAKFFTEGAKEILK